MKKPHPKTSSISEILDADAEAMILNAQDKIQSGKRLSVRERITIERLLRKQNEQAQSDPSHAKNALDLAQILGVSRQVIGYWCHRPGCPQPDADGLPVEAWRKFLELHGRVNVAPATKRPRIETFRDGFETGAQIIDIIPDALHTVLESSGAKVTAKACARAAAVLWLLCAARGHALADMHGIPESSPLAPGDDGKIDAPESVRKSFGISIEGEIAAALK